MGEPEVQAMVISTGVARFDDGWNVVLRDPSGELLVFDPTFPTEEEAMAKAKEITGALLKAYRDDGLIAFNTDHETGDIIE